MEEEKKKEEREKEKIREKEILLREQIKEETKKLQIEKTIQLTEKEKRKIQEEKEIKEEKELNKKLKIEEEEKEEREDKNKTEMDKIKEERKLEELDIKEKEEQIKREETQSDGELEEKKSKKTNKKELELNQKNEKNNEIDDNKEYRIGLENVGGTFYMNATLQCLSKTIKLSNYFLDPKNKEKIFNNNTIRKNQNDLELSTSFYELIKNLWDKKNKKGVYSPNEFKEKIRKMNSLFQGYNSGDSKDLISFILTKLHQELNTIKNNSNTNKLDQLYYKYDRNQMLNIFLEEYKRDNNSIVSNLFYGATESVSECLNCKKRNKAQGLKSKYKYNFQTINFILFPMEEIRKYRNNKFMQINANIMTPNMMTDILSNNRVFIMDCFEYYQNPVLMNEDNKIYCDVCKKLCDSNYRTKIYFPPNIMILILDRGPGMKYKVGIDFLPSIDITQYIDKDYANGMNAEYNLYAVLTYIGESSKKGHFIAFCKSHDDSKKWVCYNDSAVSEIIDFISQIHNYGIPYILFYEKI